MAQQDASSGVALGIEFMFMGMTFTGELQHRDGAARFIASAAGVDLRDLLKKNDVCLPEELKDLPNLVVDMLYLSLSLDTTNEIELFGSIELKDVGLGEDLAELGKTDLLTIYFDLMLTDGRPSVFLSLRGRPQITLIGEINCSRFHLTFSYQAGGSWKLGGSTVIGIHAREITLSACYEEIKDKTRRFQLRADFSQDPAALLSIPDVADLNPKQLTLQVVKDKAVAGASWHFSAVGDLKLYQFGDPQNVLFVLENGEIKIFDDKTKKEKGFKFLSKKAELYPLSAFPAIPADLKQLFAVGLDEIHIIHKEDLGWEFSAGCYLKLNGAFQVANPDIYSIIDKVLFPAGKQDRQLKGEFQISSYQGVAFILENSFPLIIPSIFDKLELPENLKALEDIKRLFDIGTSYFCLERVAIGIHQNFSCEATLAVGLPSKLNRVVFGEASIFNGLIKTYDERNSAKAKANLLRATLKVDTRGFSGSIEEGNFIDLAKLDQIADELIAKGQQIFNLKEGIQEEEDWIKINFDALFSADYQKDAPLKYGWIHIKKPELKLDTTSGAFKASGGYQVSEPLMLPISPIFEKLFLLFQDPKRERTGKPEILEFLPEGIPIRSIHFFPDGCLKIDQLEDWLRDCLPPKIKPLFALPAPFKQFVEREAGPVLNKLPEAFKQYLQIKFPPAFDFAVDITADGGVCLNIEVPDKQNAAEAAKMNKDHFFSNCIQLLIPVPGAVGMLYGIQLKKLAFGAALGGTCLRLDLSARVDMFDLVQLGASLLLEDKADIKDENLRLMMPDRRKLGNHQMVENLVMFIIYETVVPIPIPVYCSKIYAAYSGLEGLESEFLLSFTAEFSLADLKRLCELIGFFKEKGKPLTVDPYPYDETAGEKGIVCGAGPLYTRLPGYIGFEEIDGRKQNIILGTEKSHQFNLLDLVALGANTLKFFILNLIDAAGGKKAGELAKIPVKLKDREEEVLKKPLNYLIEYLPVDMRMGFKKIKLFYLFDLQTAWAFTTPDEFEQIVYPRMLQEYAQRNYPQTRDPSSPNDLLQLFVERDAPVTIRDEDQGVVLFLRGGMYAVQDRVVLEGAIGLAVSEQKGFRSGLSLKGKLFDWIDTASFFFAKINPADKQEIIKVLGATYLKVFERDVLKGLIAVTNKKLILQGMLDVFPAKFPVQLKGFVNGEFSPGLIDYHSRAGLQLGFFSASAMLSVHIDSGQQLLQSDLTFANAFWHFAVEHRREDAQQWFRADLSANAFNLIALEGHLRFRRDTCRLQLLGMISLSFPLLNVLHVQLDYAGELNAEAGFLSLSAQLAGNSFILSESCRPTGGAAFCLWFNEARSAAAAVANKAAAGPQAGDFVLTLGGYHPNFRVPAHYPRVPRLGINWEIDPYTHIRGEAYFAMTPLAIMAGARLDLVYQRGNIRAWFTAFADFLCQWKPFYYDAKIAVSVGASYTLRVGVKVFGKFVGVAKTFSISIKALLHLYGPPTGGRVDIQLPIVTIGIHFGQAYQPPKSLQDWQAFKEQFLDNAKNPAAGAILQMVPQSGVSGIKKTGDKREWWLARADELNFMVTTKVPAGKVNGDSAAGTSIHIKPLNRENISSTLTVSLLRGEEKIEAFEVKPIRSNVPAALWGKSKVDLLDSQNALIKGAITGLHIFAKAAARDASVLEIVEQNLGYAEIDGQKEKMLPVPDVKIAPRSVKPGSLDGLRGVISDTGSTRQTVLAALQDLGYFRQAGPLDFGYEKLCRDMQTDWRHCPEIVES